MGGSGSEEIMVESEIGDNTLLLCRECDYAANVEKASCRKDYEGGEDYDSHRQSVLSGKSFPYPPSLLNKKPIYTPGVKSIDEVCAFLHIDPKSCIKTLIYRAVNVELYISEIREWLSLEAQAKLPSYDNSDPPCCLPGDTFYAVCIRGDLDVNEVKLAAVLRASEVSLASDEDVKRLTGVPKGFIGPVKLPIGDFSPGNLIMTILDYTVTAMTDAIAGANEENYHRHVAYGDFFGLKKDVRTVKAGDRCPLCGGELYEKKGNELGHIFKLGYKYTKAMNVAYMDEHDVPNIPLMGCYGIGIDRTLASVIEEHHDEDGIIWPASVAPYHVVIVPIRYDGAVKAAADSLEAALEAAGVETLVDDRDERPGVKFKDADLTGVPWRVVIGDKNLALDPPQVEVKRRGEKAARLIPLPAAASELPAAVRQTLAELKAGHL
jgi:prolyl-tRNA synthetase